MDCDSNVRADGEGLRSIIHDVPDAVSELDLYQSNRRSLKNAAYFATLGFVSAVALYYIGRNIQEPNLKNPQLPGNISPVGRVVMDLGVFGGLGLTGGSIIYAFSVVQTNESHLHQAVENYNLARPTDPIVLQFTTKISL